METIAVDDRWSVQAKLALIEANLGGETSYRRRDLGHGDELAHVQHLRARQHQNGPLLATYLRQPDLASRH
jgi:hypothetical protein